MIELIKTVADWPPERALAVAIDDGAVRAAEPAATFRVGVVGGRPRSAWLTGGSSIEPPAVFTHDPTADLDAVLAWGARVGTEGAGWIGFFSYDLGRVIEPAVGGGGDDHWPLIELHWCPSPCAAAPGGYETSARPQGFRVGRFRSATGRSDFEGSVARVIDDIRAGDVFQANLAHRLRARFEGSARALCAALWAGASPRHGAYVELAGGEGALVSASPELFLRVDAGGRVTARPMKGTRPASADPRELDASAKDRAELNMIIDLMRNDLGRVCRVGSVRVREPRVIERHGGERGGVWQAAATVEGRLARDAGIARLLRAAFPPGSVTGAPKIRAMQIIDDLEPVPRGPYCGAAGWIGIDGTASLNVAIRTALVRGDPGGSPGQIRRGVLDYSVGAGIVADSDPASEWRETLDKAGILRGITGGSSRAASRPGAGSSRGTSG